MRYNEKEIALLSEQPADKEGRLNHKSPGFREGYRERWFKLKRNLFFYYKLNEYGAVYEKVPAGLFVLEDYTVQIEYNADIPFAFSIVFKQDIEKKHLFSCPNQQHCEQWVHVLKQASYEHWRSKLNVLQEKILQLTGIDPLDAFSHWQCTHPPLNRQQPQPRIESPWLQINSNQRPLRPAPRPPTRPPPPRPPAPTRPPRHIPKMEKAAAGDRKSDDLLMQFPVQQK